MEPQRLRAAIAGQFETMQKQIDERFKEQHAHIDARFKEQRAHIDARFKEERAPQRAYTDERISAERVATDARFDRMEMSIAEFRAHMDKRFNDLAESLDILIGTRRRQSR